MGKYGQLLYIYDLKNNIKINTETIKNKSAEDIYNDDNYLLCFKIIKTNDFLYNDLNITYDRFPWKTYYKINPELGCQYNKTKDDAWQHWNYYGKKEERSFSFINNTNNHRARFGNHFFLNMCLHMFSRKFDLKSSYKYEKMFNQLGIYFYKGKNIYTKNILLTENNFENVLESDISPRNVIINNNVWFHKNRFCKIIKKYFETNNSFFNVKKANKYREKYNNNNDLFIHVRLGDVSEKTDHLKKYYINTIDKLKYDKCFITSDSIEHPLCKLLIKKYNLTIINKSEVETIMFGSVCNNIILSGGTFSWLIGFLAEPNSNIYYPELLLDNRWYGDIFSFSNWNKVTV